MTKKVMKNKMQPSEGQPPKARRSKKFEIHSEYNNLDLLHYLYDYVHFPKGLCSTIETQHETKNELIICHAEEPAVLQLNHVIQTVQVNRRKLNSDTSWNMIEQDKNNYSNSLCAVSSFSNIRSIDLNKLLIFKRYMFYITELLFNEKIDIPQRSVFSITTTTKDLNILMKLQCPEYKSNRFHYRKKQYLCNGEMKRAESLSPKETCLLVNDTQRNDLSIALERQGIDFRISISKYSMPNFFYTIFKLCNTYNQPNPDSASINMFPLSVGNWHFLNISQGYLLKLLLRNADVSTLNIMMQLYFILITHAHPNLSIQINFRKKPELLSIHESLFLKTFSFKSVEWSEDHKLVLKSTTLHFFNEDRYPMKLSLLPYGTKESTQIETVIQIVDYEEQAQSLRENNILQPLSHNDAENVILRHGEVECNIAQSESQKESKYKVLEHESHSEAKNRVLTQAESTSVTEHNILLKSATQREPEHDILYSESHSKAENEVLQSNLKSDTNCNILRPFPYRKYSDMFRLDDITDNEVALVNSIQDVSVPDTEELKKNDIKLLNILFACGVSPFASMPGKLWGTELRQKFDDLKMYLNPHDVFKSGVINETMFDGTSVNLYEKFCKPFLCQKFVVLTLHTLGKSLGNILFNIN